MSDQNSPNLDLPYLAPSQAQKHVTHNEALRMLDALVQVSVVTRNLDTPASSPVAGARYLVGDSPTGAWSAAAGKVAAWQDGAWTFFDPQPGWVTWIEDESRLLAFDGSDWVPSIGHGSQDGLAGIGINTDADATNRLAVKSDAILFSHDDVTPGSGDMRVKLNKAVAADTATHMFQTGWSGRAELGTAGSDHFVIKVSADGSAWTDAVSIDNTTGNLVLSGSLKAGGVQPTVDNSQTLGNASFRWSAVWAVNGTIQTSDMRDKRDVSRIAGTLAARLVDTVDPVTYRWSGDTSDGRRNAGFLAQEIKAALDAEGLDVGAWGLDDPTDPDSRQWLRPDQLIALLWAALKQTRRQLAVRSPD